MVHPVLIAGQSNTIAAKNIGPYIGSGWYVIEAAAPASQTAWSQSVPGGQYLAPGQSWAVDFDGASFHITPPLSAHNTLIGANNAAYSVQYFIGSNVAYVEFDLQPMQKNSDLTLHCYRLGNSSKYYATVNITSEISGGSHPYIYQCPADTGTKGPNFPSPVSRPAGYLTSNYTPCYTSNLFDFYFDVGFANLIVCDVSDGGGGQVQLVGSAFVDGNTPQYPGPGGGTPPVGVTGSPGPGGWPPAIGASPSPTSTLSGPITICQGMSTTLTWATTSGTTVTLNGSPVAASGSQTVSPAATTAYTLTAAGAAGTTPATSTVTVTVNPVPIGSLAAVPPSVPKGTPVTLTIASTGATGATLTASDGSAPLTASVGGTVAVTPSKTTTYTLVLTDPCGRSQAAATATVLVPDFCPTPWVGDSACPGTSWAGDATPKTVWQSDAGCCS